jgi:hypothetical protein
MADLKTLLGDKYQEGMTIEELMALEVEAPKADKSAYDSLKKGLMRLQALAVRDTASKTKRSGRQLQTVVQQQRVLQEVKQTKFAR